MAGAVGSPSRFDIGAVEARRDAEPPAVVFLAPPANAHLRGVVSVRAQASDASGKVSGLTLRAGSQALTATLAPAAPAPAITATAQLEHERRSGRRPDADRHAARTRARTRGPSRRTVIVDNTPPDTMITGGPDGPVTGSSFRRSRSPGTDNLSPAAGLAFAWRAGRRCLHPVRRSDRIRQRSPAWTPGAHTFEVKARDLAGNEDPSPARRSFTVQPAAPPSRSASRPAGATVPSGLAAGPWYGRSWWHRCGCRRQWSDRGRAGQRLRGHGAGLRPVARPHRGGHHPVGRHRPPPMSR